MPRKVGVFRRNAVSWIALLGVCVTGGVQVATTIFDGPEPLVCSDVYARVLDQAEAQPGILDIPYPADSRDQKDCEINEFMVKLDESDGDSGN